jgi:hypothetical protein
MKLVVTGMPLEELPLPEGAAVTLVVRKNRLVPPRLGTTLEPGDHVHLIAMPEDRGSGKGPPDRVAPVTSGAFSTQLKFTSRRRPPPGSGGLWSYRRRARRSH